MKTWPFLELFWPISSPNSEKSENFEVNQNFEIMMPDFEIKFKIER